MKGGGSKSLYFRKVIAKLAQDIYYKLVKVGLTYPCCLYLPPNIIYLMKITMKFEGNSMNI